MSEKMDWVAFKNGNAYALCSADHGQRLVNRFFAENRVAEFKLMPIGDAVRLHMEYITQVQRTQEKSAQTR